MSILDLRFWAKVKWVKAKPAEGAMTTMKDEQPQPQLEIIKGAEGVQDTCASVAIYNIFRLNKLLIMRQSSAAQLSSVNRATARGRCQAVGVAAVTLRFMKLSQVIKRKTTNQLRRETLIELIGEGFR